MAQIQFYQAAATAIPTLLIATVLTSKFYEAGKPSAESASSARNKKAPPKPAFPSGRTKKADDFVRPVIIAILVGWAAIGEASALRVLSTGIEFGGSFWFASGALGLIFAWLSSILLLGSFTGSNVWMGAIGAILLFFMLVLAWWILFY